MALAVAVTEAVAEGVAAVNETVAEGVVAVNEAVAEGVAAVNEAGHSNVAGEPWLLAEAVYCTTQKAAS